MKTRLGANWYKICFWGGCARGTWVRNTFVGDNCIKIAWVKNTHVNNTSTKNACSVGVVKYLGIYLQSFWNLEIKSTGLKIPVIVDYIKNTYISQNLEFEYAGLEIQVKTNYIKNICIG